ncbi:hypothetical protein GIS00_24930 [Nakamurella sp. YIM 132087]|uniref:YiaAB two helix domain-containing protein n=1 Tax=Nakamurella alba TaxID=2665158 RepID=A0A7K1FVF0_9ACTN|nr:hypothetical protein [Nakamurella alba]MTD17183.1 hypothetical protein [Nakamurella alba]
MSDPKTVTRHTGAFFGAALAFLAITLLWNTVNLAMLDIAVEQRYSMAMGILSAVFATVVVSKVVRDREEANELVNGIRRARYEEVLAHSPAPGLGHL